MKGVAIMVISMASFAIGDALVKLSTSLISPIQSILLLAVFGSAIFGVLTVRAGHPLFSRALLSPPVLIRNFVESLTGICIFSALAAAPLSLVVAITQAVPLLVTLGAAILLRESVGPRRWAAVLIGLAGVLIMMRPWSAGLAPGAILAILGTIGLATRDLASRFVAPSVPNLQLVLWGTLSLFPTALIILPITGPHPALTLPSVGLLAVTAVATSIGYYGITAAMRVGDVSLVAPFRYLRLPFALALAVLFFGERPDGWTLLGAAIVIASGLFVMIRERRLSRQSSARS